MWIFWKLQYPLFAPIAPNFSKIPSRDIDASMVLMLTIYCPYEATHTAIWNETSRLYWINHSICLAYEPQLPDNELWHANCFRLKTIVRPLKHYQPRNNPPFVVGISFQVSTQPTSMHLLLVADDRLDLTMPTISLVIHFLMYSWFRVGKDGVFGFEGLGNFVEGVVVYLGV